MYEPAELGGHLGGADVATVATDVRVLVLGPLVVEHADKQVHVAGTHRRRLLALLASRCGQLVRTESIIDALWGDEPPPTAARTVHSHVARLRSSFAGLGCELVETVPGGYRLALDAGAVDAVVFERLAAEGRRSVMAGDLAAGATLLSRALALWRGPAYAESVDAPFAAAEAVRLDELRAEATEALAEARLESGALASVTADLEQLVAAQPGREQAWALLMRALYASGRQNDALVAFQRAAGALAESFGLAPGPELRTLERRILEQDPTLTIRRERKLPVGLRRDSNHFVGRDREVAWLVAAWEAARNGRGQVRVVLGAVDSGRTRLAAEVAALALGDGGQVIHARAADGVGQLIDGHGASSQGAAVDSLRERSRASPVLVVVDDAEWAAADMVASLASIAAAIEHQAAVLLVIADPSAGGPAVQAIRRLDRSGAATRTLAALDDESIARIAVDDGVEPGVVPAVVAVAGGLPGVARREAASWSERVAGERLHLATAASLDAAARADEVGDSVLGEVIRLVAARARRHRLTSATWVGRQPYRALSPYEADDVDLFVGRERLVAELTARVLDRRLVVVVGPSGSGKSSIVRAGLVPLVESGRLPGQRTWRSAVVVPGHDPMAAVEAVPGLDDPDPQLLVIDQFEEAFAAGSDAVDTLACRLIDLVLDPALDAHVVLVVRADRFGALTESRPLAELARGGQVLVGPPSIEEVRRIIEEPALRTGCTVEAALVEMLTADVDGHDAMLPLLSVALADLWTHRDHDVMLASHFVAVGGLAGAVERMGDAALDRVGPGGVDRVRRALLMLADVTEDGAWLRRRVAIERLPDDLADAVGALVDARLVVRDGQEVQVVHEVVYRAWPRLAAWLDEARSDLVLGRELRQAARAWEADERTDDDVLRGARLVAAEALVARNTVGVEPLVAEFVAAGRLAAEREHAALAAQLERETTARQRFGRALVVASVLLVLALVAGTLAVIGRRQAVGERRRADAAESERAVDNRLDLALLLAVEAWRRADTVDTRGALLTALTSNVSADRPLGLSTSNVAAIDRTPSSFRGFVATSVGVPSDVDISDDGATVAVVGSGASRPGTIAAVYDVQTRRETAAVDLARDQLRLDLSPDGQRLLASGPSIAELVDVRDGSRTPIALADRADDAISAVTFSPDGATIAVSRLDGTVAFYDGATGAAHDLAAPPRTLGLAAFLPDGSLAFGLDAGVGFWDVETGTLTSHVELAAGVPGDVNSYRYVFSPARTRLLATEPQGRVFVWDLLTAQLVGPPNQRPGLVQGSPAFVSDSTVALGQVTGGLTFYDLVGERQLGEPLDVHGGGIWDIAVTPDRQTLVAAADDGLLSLWGVNDRGLIDEPALDESQYIAFGADGADSFVATRSSVERRAPDGTTLWTQGRSGVLMSAAPELVVAGDRVLVIGAVDMLIDPPGPETGRAALLDAATGVVVWRNDLGSPFAEIGVATDGHVVYEVAADRSTLTGYDADTGAAVATVRASDLGATAFTGAPSASADGRYVDIVAERGVARLAADGLRVERYVELGEPVYGDVAYVPETDDLVVGSGVGRLYRIDMSDGSIVAVGRSRDASRIGGIAVSRDGAMIAAGHVFTNQIALFDAFTLKPIGRPLPAGNGRSTPVFSSNGDLLARGLFGLSRWNLDPDFWRAQACRAAGRNLTRAEWAEYVDDAVYRASCSEWPADV